MKRTFTLIALAMSGLAQAQPHLQRYAFTMPPASRIRAETVAALGFGPQSILDAQSRPDAEAKTTATAQRLTGWSRHDLDAGIRTDTTAFLYSGMRGSQFANEQLNLTAGNYLVNAQPDRFIRKDKDGGVIDIEQRYDAANRVTERTFRSATYQSRSAMTYDAGGNLLKTIESDSASGVWTPQLAYYFRYNAAGIRILDSVFSIQDNEPQSTSYYRLNSLGLPDTLDSYAWNGSTFERQYLSVNTRNASGAIVYTTSYFVDESNNLIPNERFEYMYTPGKELKENIFSINVNGTWMPRSRDTIGYTGSKTLHTYLQNDIWDDNAAAWQPLRASRYTLNAGNRWNAEYISERKSTGTLVPVYRREISYNNAGNLVAGTKSYEYVPASGGYATMPFDEERFYYESHQTTAVAHAKKPVAIRLFPNPANTTITIEAGAASPESAVIMGASGLRMTAAMTAERTQHIDISALPAGLYFMMIRLRDGSSPQTLRFVKH